MANITITTSGNIFNVDFGDYTSVIGVQKSTFQKSKIAFSLMPADFVRVEVQDSPDFAVTWQYDINAPSVLQIDTINGVAPTSNADLYDKLAALL